MANKAERLSDLTVAQLKELATRHDVDLQGATKKDEIVEALASTRKVTVAEVNEYTIEVEEGTPPEVSAENVGLPDGGNTGRVKPVAGEGGETPETLANTAGVASSQLDTAPPMKDESGSNLPAPNLTQPVIEGALGEGTGSPDALDPALTKPEEAAIARVEGRTSDSASRIAGNTASDTPPDLSAGLKESDAGPEQYPFPTQGDVDIATVDPGNGKGEYLPKLELEDWVVLDGSHDLVPDSYDGRRAVVLDAPRYLIPVGDEDKVWITVRTRDEDNSTLSIPLSAVKQIDKGGKAPGARI